MANLAYANSIFSTLFRLAAYVFLEVIPARPGKIALPVLYALYLATYFLVPPPTISAAVAEHDEPEAEPKLVEKADIPEPTIEPPSPPPGPYLSIPTILFSLPTPLRDLRILNFIINLLLFLASIDLVLHPYFDDASGVVYTRVGAVYPDAAKIVVRYPRTDSIRITWRQVSNANHSDPDLWRDGPLVNLTSDFDWIDTIKLDGLYPSTNYEYRLEDENNTVLPYPATPIRFHTFPDPLLHSGSHFRFVASSCITPNFPYVPLQGRRIKGFDLLAEHIWPTEQPVVPTVVSASVNETEDVITHASATLQTASSFEGLSSTSKDVPASPAATAEPLPAAAKPPTEFMIFMGDFIYADVPVYFGDDKEAYRRLYRRNYQSNSFRKVYERLPIFHTYDDHEIINNFAGQANDSLAPYPNASDAFRLYNADANFDSPVEGQHYYDFRYGDVAFFVMDTRRYRSGLDIEDPASRTMLGDRQLAALYDWLGKVNNTATFKFIVTSVPFTSLWGHDAATDSWAGFAYEKTALLSALHSVRNVILLSGDRHEFAAIQYASETGHNVLEVSTSPLSMFYVPFVRTLRPRSEGVVRQTRDVVRTLENGTVVNATETEEVPQELVLRYIAPGNHKWSSIEVDTRDLDHPVAKVDIIIDGQEAYSLKVVGNPVNLHPSTALGALMPRTFKGVLDKIGLSPSRWF
ncbi:hypothetical protein SCP_0409440 [Sparassis crispa]|uniref:PhoD-like phosphatase metallophosphatase domain-containing protein n=1 Tax=Sparassis crispa TaxID=139825 RepID=A0A401GK71_9APHY|nr:hypothetical protein SCP_0409440 [Sparassis crispa]GBE82560.1 hypothetical protein SCP_0409440 [Sparassis crispa]